MQDKEISGIHSLFYLIFSQYMYFNFLDIESGRSVACNGKFLYTTNTQGKGVAKVGTGLHGTLR